MLAELVSHVIGVDTHKDTHTAAVVASPTTALVALATEAATAAGYEALLELADAHTTAGERAWAIEGTGSYGAGLTTFLRQAGEWVIEVERPNRPRRRDAAKSDALDAERAARDVLGREKWAEPRARGDREALRVLVTTRDGAVRERTRAINELKAVMVGCPEDLRDRLRPHRGTTALVDACARLRERGDGDEEWRATVVVLRALAARIRHLCGEIADYDRRIGVLTLRTCPQVVAEHGVGPVSAARTYLAWSHPGRCRNEAAFARLGGTSPIEASTGKTVRHRLNRGGDRQLNRALHTVVITRARNDPRTRAYIARRTAEGKTEREIRRCLKRYLARHLYRLLEAGPEPVKQGP